MNLEVLDQAIEDLLEGFHFYEDQQHGLGSYFVTNLFADIESLRVHGGVHRQVYKDYHRLLSKRFPFSVFYKVQNGLYSFTLWLTADVTPRGFVNDWNKVKTPAVRERSCRP